MAVSKHNTNIVHFPYEEEIDRNKALSEYIFEALTKNSAKIAQVDSDTRKTETFGQLLQRSLSLAQSFKQKGVTTNDLVAQYCYNNMDYIAVMVATMFCGARFCCLDIGAPKMSTVHCLKLASPVLIFCDQISEDVLQSSIKEAGIECEIITFDKTDKFTSMEDFVEKYKKNENFKIDTSRKLKDSGCIAFTSGTSGLSKGAELSNFGLYYGGMNSLKTCSANAKVMIFTLPYWISNISYCMYSLLFGIERVIYKTFDLKTVIKAIQDFKVTNSLFSQYVMNDLIKNPQYVTQYDTSNFRLINVAGSKLGVNVLAQMKKILPHTKVVNTLGMTEIAGIVLHPNEELVVDADDNISVGKPHPGFHYKVVDIQSGEVLGPQNKGELRVKYDGILTGYLDQPEATKEAFDEDGFFKTGDIVYYDANYNFFVVGRLKEIFKFRGSHISPSIIEDTLLLHPAVKESTVIPVPHERDGDWPMAVVKIMENSKVTKEEIIQFIAERLADRYHLRGGVSFVDSIPKNSSGKVLRKELETIVLGQK